MALIRFFFVFAVILLYFALTVFFLPFLRLRPYGTKKVLNHLVSGLSVLLIWILKVKVKEDSKVPRDGSYLLVGNHLGYLDVLILSAYSRCSFVTSTDIRDTPFLGQICQLAGCLFVNRKSRKNISKEIADISLGLERGMNVAVFPEATSTNGEGVLKFKRSLFQAAIDAGVPVIPFTLNYTRCGKEKVSVGNRDNICWYGDMTFLPHLWSLCKSGGVECELSWHHALPPNGLDSSDLRDYSYALVSEAYRPIKESSQWVKKHFKAAAF